MIVVVIRSGGFAGLTRIWQVDTVTVDQGPRIEELAVAAPWDEQRPAQPPAPEPVPDRFVIEVRADDRSAVLGDEPLPEPWEELVTLVRALSR